MGAKCQEIKAKYKLSEENLDAYEAKMLTYSGLDQSKYEVKNVEVGEYKKQKVTIRTIIVGTEEDKQNKPTLVFCHGYGGSAAMFFRIMKPLSEKFYLILIDIIGMGGSSRPKDYKEHKFSPAESVQYFNDYFEKWRVAMGNITDFYLSAHSFGGYIMGNYAAAYHKHIKKVLLVSPIGVLERPPGFNMVEEFKKRSKENNGGKGPPAWALSAFGLAWKRKISVFGVARTMGRAQTLKRMDGFVARQQKKEDKERQECIRDYLYQIYMRPGTTEYALMVMFETGLLCPIPLGRKDRLGASDFPIPVSFIYGDSDWVLMVEENGPKTLVENHPDQANSHFLTCPGAGHNMHMDNPVALANLMINELLGENLEITLPTEVFEDFDDNVITEPIDETKVPENNNEEDYQDNDEEDQIKN